MRPLVVDLPHPRREQRVQPGQVVQFAARADLDEELVSHRSEEPLDFASALGLARPGVDQPDAQAGAGALQLLVDHG
jgi:hypothetical protein